MPSDNGHKLKDKKFHLYTRKNSPLRVGGRPGAAARAGAAVAVRGSAGAAGSVNGGGTGNGPGSGTSPAGSVRFVQTALRTRPENRGRVEHREGFSRHMCNHRVYFWLISVCTFLNPAST